MIERLGVGARVGRERFVGVGHLGPRQHRRTDVRPQGRHRQELAREADAGVLIVRHGKSSKTIVRRARDLLLRAGAPLTGIALNAVDLNSPEYYGYYGYTGYSYAGVDTNSWAGKSKTDDSAEGDRS